MFSASVFFLHTDWKPYPAFRARRLQSGTLICLVFFNQGAYQLERGGGGGGGGGGQGSALSDGHNTRSSYCSNRQVTERAPK